MMKQFCLTTESKQVNKAYTQNLTTSSVSDLLSTRVSEALKRLCYEKRDQRVQDSSALEKAAIDGAI